MTFNLEYVEEATQKRLALSAGALVPLGFDELIEPSRGGSQRLQQGES